MNEKMQEIRSLACTVAVFYLLEQLILQLLPGKRYERYVRFYLGLLLVLLLLQPFFRWFQLTEQMDSRIWLEEMEAEMEELR